MVTLSGGVVEEHTSSIVHPTTLGEIVLGQQFVEEGKPHVDATFVRGGSELDEEQ